MSRFARLALLVTLAALTAIPSAAAAPRMWIGFQDDWNFRWRAIRHTVRDRSVEANANIVRASVNWYAVAPRRPQNPEQPFDEAYRWEDVDEFVREAQRHDQEVMLAIWGTPWWATPTRRPNRAPANLRDLTQFAQALSNRYSGRHAGYPFVRFYGVWNEPNLGLFLMPQFDSRGRSVSPALYARMYRAAYAGIKAGNPRALVAIGETSARGRDRKRAGVSDTHSPGRFAQLVAQADRRIPFDAWAHHPYPTQSHLSPTQVVRWPNVTFAMIPRFSTSLDRWFGRRVRLWITEYGHETKPQEPRGVTYAQQARYTRIALQRAARHPRIDMFIWFVFRDDRNMPWQSGLLDYSGTKKPAFNVFSSLARLLDARNPYLTIRPGQPRYFARFPAQALQFRHGANARVGMTYRIYLRGRLVGVGQFESKTDIEGWVPFFFQFPAARAGNTYQMQLDVNTITGATLRRTFTLVVR